MKSLLDTLDIIEAPFLRVLSTINGQNAIFTIKSVVPCSENIYCIFRDMDNNLYAVQNMGCMAIGTLEYNDGSVLQFLLPVTKILIEKQAECLMFFVRWLRYSELPPGIPVVSESFNNPFLG